jgi:hypothetical protein
MFTRFKVMGYKCSFQIVFSIFHAVFVLSLFITISRGRKLNVALFGDLGRNFDAELVSMQGRKAPIFAVFAGMLVRWYKGLISTLSYVKQHYMYIPISLCYRSHITVMLFRQRIYSLLNINFKVLLGFGYTTGARVPCKVPE